MSEIFNTDATFESLGLRPAVLKGITEMGFEQPREMGRVAAWPAGSDLDAAIFAVGLEQRQRKPARAFAGLLQPGTELVEQFVDGLRNAVGQPDRFGEGQAGEMDHRRRQGGERLGPVAERAVEARRQFMGDARDGRA